MLSADLSTRAATITIVNLDGANEGFNDPTPVAPVGGNPGATIGQQRLNVFQRAAEIWGARLVSSVPIRVGANFDPLSCTASSGTLGSAGPVDVYSDFAGAPLAATWYVSALANALAGEDLDPALNDIDATFNSDVGKSGCLSSFSWYYGLDGNQPANSFDLLDTVLHELAHGLGFISLVSLSSGGRFLGLNDTFGRFLEDHSTGKTYPQMTDAQRVTASLDTGDLHWIGTNVVAASGFLVSGTGAGGHVQMYAPNPAESGSSVSHFSTALSPNELMEPFATATSDLRLTAELFKDIGWTVLNAAPAITTNGMSIADENCSVNGALDIGETVTVDFALRNTGTGPATNVVATLLSTGGVTFPSEPQGYGALAPQGATVTRPFTFTATGSCFGSVTATLQLRDGTNSLGSVAFTFRLGATLSFTNATNISIPASGTATPYRSTLTVSGVPNPASNVVVRLLNITHNNPDDLDILLVGPGGQTVMLMSDAGGGGDLAGVTLTLDNAAANALPDSSQLSTGTNRPANYGANDGLIAPAPAEPYGTTLAVFNGPNPNGVWELFVRDDASPRSGNIAGGWSLNFPTCCVNTNTPPMLTLPGGPLTYVENSDAVVLGSAVTISDASSTDFSGGTLSVTIATNASVDDRLSIMHQGSAAGEIGISGNTITYGGAVIGSFTGGANGTSPLVVTFTTTSATPAAAQALARNITFANVSEAPSPLTRTVRFVLRDGDGGTSLPAALAISVIPVNDAPILNNAGNPIIASINEDASVGTINGASVPTLTPGTITDPDTGAVSGIAVIATDETNGVWQFTTNGVIWMNFGAVSESSARLVARTASARVRFLPVLNFNGIATISFRAWDQTSGVNGGITDTSINGGTTAFSSAVETATITVNSINDAPVLAPIASRTIHQGMTLAFTNSATDVETPSVGLTFSLTNAPAGAAIQAASGLFTWTPAPAQADSTNVIGVMVTDNGSPSLIDTETFTVTVVPRPQILSITVAAGNVTLTWSAIAGRIYRLQHAPDLDAPTWSDLPGDVTAGGPIATRTNGPVTAEQRFYRVMALE